jgi:hypothetical protein
MKFTKEELMGAAGIGLIAAALFIPILGMLLVVKKI